MKRFLLVGAVLIAMYLMLCVGLALGIVISPVKDTIAQRIERVLSQADPDERVAPRVIVREPVIKIQGVRILEVLPGSPAERAGLEAGMLITAIDDQPLNRVSDLPQALAEFEPGDQVQVTVMPAGSDERSVTVTLGKNPDQPDAAWLGIRYGRQVRPRWKNLWTPEEGGQILPKLPDRPFGVLPESRLDPEILRTGALIREVVADSPAETAGLKPGQVIRAVDGEQLNDPRTLPDIIASHEPGDAVTLTIVDPAQEDEKNREVEVTLGENPDQPGAAWLGIRFAYLNLERLDPQNLPED